MVRWRNDVYQDVYGQAEEAFNVCMRILNGETFEQTTYVPFKLITKDNVDRISCKFLSDRLIKYAFTAHAFVAAAVWPLPDKEN